MFNNISHAEIIMLAAPTVMFVIVIELVRPPEYHNVAEVLQFLHGGPVRGLDFQVNAAVQPPK